MVALTGGSWCPDECAGLLEFVQAAERGSVRPGRVDQLEENVCDRPKRFRGGVDQVGVDAGTSGEKSVLSEHLFRGAGVL